jgi:23S rRNA pseudouridine1911/1915/1917 synthase
VPEAETELRVGPQDGGKRLDVFLSERLALSRREAQRLVARGLVTVEGGRAVKGESLALGALVRVAPFVPEAEMEILPDPDLTLVFLQAGEGFVVVDKPAGVPVMPREPDERGTVLNALAAVYPQFQGVGEGGLRSGVVHRLDTDTSGALLVATEEAAWARFRQAFEERRVEKRYVALVHGWLWGEGRESVDLAVASHRPAHVRVVKGDPSARPCALEWRVLENVGDCTLLDITLETGFLHQIRVTMAHLGHPVVGDALYGERGRPLGAPRQLLHAARLAVDEVAAESPLPEDFQAVLRALRAG